MNEAFRSRVILVLALILLTAPSTAAAQESEQGSAVVLLYHRFGEPRYAEASVGLELFDQHLAELTSGRYDLLSVPALLDALEEGRPLPERGVVVTIDDGFLSVYTEAWPRLRAEGVPFTLYIAPELLDLGGRDYMTWDQLREMAADPLVTIDSHGFAHAHMIDMPLAEARADLALAARRLEEELGLTPRSFAYPYGEYGLALRDLVAESGLAAAFGTQSGPVAPGDDIFALPRFSLGGSQAGMERFKLVVNTLPLPLRWMAPRDPLLDPNRQPQLLAFQLEGVGRGAAPTCYYRGRLLHIDAEGNDQFAGLLPAPIPRGRHRVNCTRPGPDGRWRWTGLQVYMPRGAP